MYVKWTGKRIACGYEDGGVRVWDLRECATTMAMAPPPHKAPVNCISASSDGTLIMTGSEDATARLVNTATGKVRTFSQWAKDIVVNSFIFCEFCLGQKY